jgi:hypothetical protein
MMTIKNFIALQEELADINRQINQAMEPYRKAMEPLIVQREEITRRLSKDTEIIQKTLKDIAANLPDEATFSSVLQSKEYSPMLMKLLENNQKL